MVENEITIVKIGTDTLIDECGAPRDEIIQDILKSFAEELAADKKTLLVTSGAVKVGRSMARDDTMLRSAAASIGQPALFSRYARAAKQSGIVLAELLLSRSYLARRKEFSNLQETIGTLFARKVIPIANENDASVAGTDWSFGDNDGLAAALAVMLKAKQLIIMTHLDGLFEKDPVKNPDASLIAEVDNLSDGFLHYCSPYISQSGSGGMISKLKSARICTATGIEVKIINGLIAGNLRKALNGERVGTVFRARALKGDVSNRDRWILAAKNSWGSIEIDDGAAAALRQGKSLLAVGVRKVYGQFEAKEIIEIIDQSAHGVAYGVIAFSKREIEEMLATKRVYRKQLMHANNAFILK